MDGQRMLCNSIRIKKRVNDEQQNKSILFFCSILLLFLISISFVLGRYEVTVRDVVSALKSLVLGDEGELVPAIEAVVLQIRFPRILAAVLIGSSLAVSGGAYQGTFRNPMVSPDILGASAGASFGAALGILLSLPSYSIQILSFIVGVSAVFFSYIVSEVIGHRENTTLVLVLSGMVVSALFSAFISIAKYLADPYSKLPEITFWLMGGLSTITLEDLKFVTFPILLSTALLMLLRWRLNVLAFGDEEASSLGVNTKKLRVTIIICATMLTASAVSVSGQIGWVGLIIPHLGRMLVGPNYKHLLPVTLLVGSVFLLVVDNIARNILPVEIPLGILTAIIGAPFFIFLILRGKKGWA